MTLMDVPAGRRSIANMSAHKPINQDVQQSQDR
jgi:hypothetical protein